MKPIDIRSGVSAYGGWLFGEQGMQRKRLRLGGRLFARSATPELPDAVLDDDSCVGA
jgi:hypothetical protein